MKQILLTGANFVNRGAEAMLLTALGRLTRTFPQTQLVASTYIKSELRSDKFEFSDSGKSFECRLVRDPITVKKLLLQSAWTFLPFESLRNIISNRYPYLKVIEESELVIDLSGFALSDRRPSGRRLTYALEVLTANAAGKPFVAFTQAFGPFKKLLTKALARLCLPRMSLLLVRGEKSLSNIKELGIKSLPPLEVCADSAFLFEGGEGSAPSYSFSEKLPVVGLCPNINILRAFSPEVEAKYMEALLKISRKVTREYNCNLLLFCHESGHGKTSDRYVIEQLKEKLEGEGRVKVLTEEINASSYRQLVKGFEFLVSSRFHALVGAIATATPFLGIAWAHKYFELSEEAGIPLAVIDCENATEGEIILCFEELWNRRKEVSAVLKESSKRLKSSGIKAFSALEAFKQ